jgi:multidrug efflux pump subunit AcrA (membrane-fusion protein)
MLRHALSLAVPLSLISLLVACGNGETVEAPARPAMVVHPLPAADAVDTYPGEVRARFEPELAFRIGGKIAKRLVDAGDRVRKDQPLAELDAEDVKLQLEAARAQVNAAEANLRSRPSSMGPATRPVTRCCAPPRMVWWRAAWPKWVRWWPPARPCSPWPSMASVKC